MRLPAAFASFVLVLTACTGAGPATPEAPDAVSTPGTVTDRPPVSADGEPFEAAPDVPDGPVDDAVLEGLDRLFADAAAGTITTESIAPIVAAGDPRAAWFITDLMRFIQQGFAADALSTAFADLTGVTAPRNPFGSAWGTATDRLIAWDVPAFDEYRDYKRRLFGLVDSRWEFIFDDPDAEIDWRLLSWGGVLIDDRELGDPAPCVLGCIPAIDDPAVTDAAGGGWYPDDRLVFGVAIGDEARAYPKHIMEVHEMVNDTLGGRRIGMPYCTLCGSAQAYLTDSVPDGVEIPVLRTSGLLSRSNKVMYDLVSGSVFDTFTGAALSGPLQDSRVRLEQITVVTSTWGAWRDAYPHTTIVAEDGGLGRAYPEDPLGGRDDDGPIFPIGDVDPRYSAHTPVIGVVTADGTTVAFAVDAAQLAFGRGERVNLAGVELLSDGTGFRALASDGTELAAHQAFWFAWSQFHPDSAVWPDDA